MGINVREIIKEACCRVNIVPRRQAVPGDILENAYRLLKGIVAKYNFDNLLAWTQNSIIFQNHELIHIYDKSDVLKGKNNLYFNNVEDLNSYVITAEDHENDVWAVALENMDLVLYVTRENGTDYEWEVADIDKRNSQRYQEMLRYVSMEHVQVKDVAKIDSMYLMPMDSKGAMFKLEFSSHSDFDKFNSPANVFTYTQKSEGEWLIELKPEVGNQPMRIKLNYNEGIRFDDGVDTDLFIPDNYVELLIAALAHKLALMYPRLDDAQMTRLENEVRVLVDNVRTPKASDGVIQREDYWDPFVYGRPSILMRI